MENFGMILLLAGTYIIEMKKGNEIFTPFTIFINSPKHYYIIIALVLFTITSILDKALLIKYNLVRETIATIILLIGAFLILKKRLNNYSFP